MGKSIHNILYTISIPVNSLGSVIEPSPRLVLYFIAPVPRLDFSFHASHSYPACSFLLFIPPLVPHVETCSRAASVARLSLFTSRLTSHILMYSEFLDSNILKEILVWYIYHHVLKNKK